MKIKSDNAEYAIEYRKGYKWNQDPNTLYRYMECKLCGQMTPAAEDATAVTCPECVIEMTPYVEKHRRQKSDKPRGWQWMNEYIHSDGTVYHRGKEQPHLKGKLKPTEIKTKIKLTKSQKETIKLNAASILSVLKIEFNNATSIREQKKIRAEINRQTKLAQGKFNKKFIKNFLDSI